MPFQRWTACKGAIPRRGYAVAKVGVDNDHEVFPSCVSHKTDLIYDTYPPIRSRSCLLCSHERTHDSSCSSSSSVCCTPADREFFSRWDERKQSCWACCTHECFLILKRSLTRRYEAHSCPHIRRVDVRGRSIIFNHLIQLSAAGWRLQLVALRSLAFKALYEYHCWVIARLSYRSARLAIYGLYTSRS